MSHKVRIQENHVPNRKKSDYYILRFLGRKTCSLIYYVFDSNQVQVTAFSGFDLFRLFFFAHSFFDSCTHKTHK